MARCSDHATRRSVGDALALLAARRAAHVLLLMMARFGSINRLVSTLLFSSRVSRSRWIDWTLALALACTALTVASAVSLMHFHYLDRP